MRKRGMAEQRRGARTPHVRRDEGVLQVKVSIVQALVLEHRCWLRRCWQYGRRRAARGQRKHASVRVVLNGIRQDGRCGCSGRRHGESGKRGHSKGGEPHRADLAPRSVPRKESGARPLAA